MLLCRQRQVVCDGAGDCAGHLQLVPRDAGQSAAVYACCCDKCLSPYDYVLNCWLGGCSLVRGSAWAVHSNFCACGYVECSQEMVMDSCWTSGYKKQLRS